MVKGGAQPSVIAETKNDPKNLAPSIFSRIPQDGSQPSVIRAGQEENVETDGRGGQ